MAAMSQYDADYQREYRKRPYVREKARLYSREYRRRPKSQEWIKKYSKESYDFWKAHGICVWCHQEASVPGRVLCAGCREKSKARNKRQGAGK